MLIYNITSQLIVSAVGLKKNVFSGNWDVGEGQRKTKNAVGLIYIVFQILLI